MSQDREAKGGDGAVGGRKHKGMGGNWSPVKEHYDYAALWKGRWERFMVFMERGFDSKLWKELSGDALRVWISLKILENVHGEIIGTVKELGEWTRLGEARYQCGLDELVRAGYVLLNSRDLANRRWVMEGDCRMPREEGWVAALREYRRWQQIKWRKLHPGYFSEMRRLIRKRDSQRLKRMRRRVHLENVLRRIRAEKAGGAQEVDQKGLVEWVDEEQSM